jgi:SAM-dependent methyltransferase
VIVDLGCGDGRAAIAMAATAPEALVLAVDPVAGTMAEGSRRARRSAPNALFVAASAEAFAAELPGVADRVVLNFPWSGLLRGVLGLEPAVGAAIATIATPGGCVEALISVTARDGVPGIASIDTAALDRLCPSPSLEVISACVASRDDVLASRSTWGRRLLAGDPVGRVVWRLAWRRR